MSVGTDFRGPSNVNPSTPDPCFLAVSPCLVSGWSISHTIELTTDKLILMKPLEVLVVEVSSPFSYLFLTK